MGLDFFEVYLELEEEFDVRILDYDLLPVERVGDLYDVLIMGLREQHPERFVENTQYEETVWEQYVNFLVNQLGLHRNQIVKSAYFVRDLKLY